MSAFANRWRDWATLVIGGYLVSTPWLFGVSTDVPGFASAWLVGIFLILVTLWAMHEAAPRAAILIRIGIGVWLLASPLALSFTDSFMAWNTWIAGAFVLALTSILNLAFDLQSWLRSKRLGYRVRVASPQQVTNAPTLEEHTLDTDRLSQQIVERSYQIYRTLQHQPSDMEAEMCALGYRACVEDMITLAHLIDKEFSVAGPARRMRLKMVRVRTAQSLSRVRTALPQDLRRSGLHGNEVT